MIKQLIHDIAFDKISLSQALTRAKIIAYKIGNENFKNWLKYELEGYKFNSPELPKYKKIWAPIHLIAEFPNGQVEEFPVVMPENTKKEILDTLDFHRSTEAISIVEEQIRNLKESKGFIEISQYQLAMLSKLYQKQIDYYDGTIKRGRRKVGKAQYQNIIELTKQSLLDTLMQLESEFPNLIDDYKMTKENDEKVQNIITNNIYGNNNPMNIAVGQKVKQTGNTISISTSDVEKLESLGVEKQQIEELDTIIAENVNDKESLKNKAMKWLGAVSASVAARGLYDNIPEITDFIQNLI